MNSSTFSPTFIFILLWANFTVHTSPLDRLPITVSIVLYWSLYTDSQTTFLIVVDSTHTPANSLKAKYMWDVYWSVCCKPKADIRTAVSQSVACMNEQAVFLLVLFLPAWAFVLWSWLNRLVLIEFQAPFQFLEAKYGILLFISKAYESWSYFRTQSQGALRGWPQKRREEMEIY